jgi:hypothetical protein
VPSLNRAASSLRWRCLSMGGGKRGYSVKIALHAQKNVTGCAAE